MDRELQVMRAFLQYQERGNEANAASKFHITRVLYKLLLQ